MTYIDLFGASPLEAADKFATSGAQAHKWRPLQGKRATYALHPGHSRHTYGRSLGAISSESPTGSKTKQFKNETAGNNKTCKM